MEKQAVTVSRVSQNKTSSILQRLSVVLAVTAASYGLNPSQAQASPGSSQLSQTRLSAPAASQPKRVP